MPDRMGSINFIFAQLFCSTSEKKAFGVIVAVTFIFLFLSTGNVLAFSSGQNANLVLGQASFGSGTYAINRSGFDQPEQVAFGPAGNAWITDTANNRILEFKKPFSNGEDASLVIGQRGFVTRNSAINQSGLSFPEQISFDSSGNLWVPDSSNNRILEFKKPFSNGEDASLVIGQRGFTTNSGAINQTGLNTPAQQCFDPSGNLWALDTGNNRILEFKKPFSNGEDASLVIGQREFKTNKCATSPREMRSQEQKS